VIRSSVNLVYMRRQHESLFRRQGRVIEPMFLQESEVVVVVMVKQVRDDENLSSSLSMERGAHNL
jgi:hypothetical protein